MNELSPVQLAFRNAMASLSAAVNIITTSGPHGVGGITVSAVSSVTDSPPTVLACVNRNSGMHDVFAGNGRVAVNVLSHDQDQMALHFAGVTKIPMGERMAWDDWDTLEGLPVLRDAVVVMAGRITQAVEVGTHSVFFIELDAVETREERHGLVYFRRTFRAVKPGDEKQVPDWAFFDEWSDPSMVTFGSISQYDEAFRTGSYDQKTLRGE